MKLAVERVLKRLGMRPIILNEQVNGGDTIFDKFEKNTNVGFAVVLLSPDDVGYEKSNPKEPRPRARQNVILELGYLTGKLGRSRVCVLKNGGDLEIPTDILGVAYESYDQPNGMWQLRLAQELRHAGYEVDSNKLTGG